MLFVHPRSTIPLLSRALTLLRAGVSIIMSLRYLWTPKPWTLRPKSSSRATSSRLWRPAVLGESGHGRAPESSSTSPRPAGKSSWGFGFWVSQSPGTTRNPGIHVNNPGFCERRIKAAETWCGKCLGDKILASELMRQLEASPTLPADGLLK